MTERKSFKRQVRARMAKTGERYTAARRHVAGKEPELDLAALGLVPDESRSRQPETERPRRGELAFGARRRRRVSGRTPA